MPKFKIGKAERFANITFEGTDYDGLEVRCKLDLTLAEVLKIQKLSVSDDDTQTVQANKLWCDTVLDSWNLTDDKGKDIPANSESAVGVVPARLLAVLISKWSSLTSEPPPNLSSPQNGTPTLEILAKSSQ